MPLHRGLTTYQIDTRSELLEQNLIEYQPDTGRIIPPENTTILILNSASNDSYKLAFRALHDGLSVNRIEDSVFYGTQVFLPGSFVVKNNAKPEPLSISSAMKSHVATLSEKPMGKLNPVQLPRIALVETHFHDMDAGWTRYVFDTYHIPFTVIHPGDFESTELSDYDVLVFPDSDKDILMKGKYKSDDDVYNIPFYPTEYTKGIGKEGLEKIAAYIDQGGKIVSWGRSTRLFMGELSFETKEKDEEKVSLILPVKDISPQLSKKGLYCPGTLLNINLKNNHPITWGMPVTTQVFSRGRPVFVTNIPGFDMDRRVIGTYPKKEVLASGYIAKPEMLSNQSACVWLRKNKGQLILFGFGPQFRASTTATYKLLFNSILLQ